MPMTFRHGKRVRFSRKRGSRNSKNIKRARARIPVHNYFVRLLKKKKFK